MACKTVWTCDGCDKDAVMAPDSTSGNDWKRITVTLDGFRGYPVGQHANAEHSYELCPSCQSRLADAANPRQWAHLAPASPPYTPSDE